MAEEHDELEMLAPGLWRQVEPIIKAEFARYIREQRLTTPATLDGEAAVYVRRLIDWVQSTHAIEKRGRRLLLWNARRLKKRGYHIEAQLAPHLTEEERRTLAKLLDNDVSPKTLESEYHRLRNDAATLGRQFRDQLTDDERKRWKRFLGLFALPRIDDAHQPGASGSAFPMAAMMVAGGAVVAALLFVGLSAKRSASSNPHERAGVQLSNAGAPPLRAPGSTTVDSKDCAARGHGYLVRDCLLRWADATAAADPNRAKALFEQALQVPAYAPETLASLGVIAPHPDVAYDQQTADAYDGLAWIAFTQGRTATALAAYRLHVETASRIAARHPRLAVRTYQCYILHSLHRRAGDYQHADDETCTGTDAFDHPSPQVEVVPTYEAALVAEALGRKEIALDSFARTAAAWAWSTAPSTEEPVPPSGRWRGFFPSLAAVSRGTFEHVRPLAESLAREGRAVLDGNLIVWAGQPWHADAGTAGVQLHGIVLPESRGACVLTPGSWNLWLDAAPGWEGWVQMRLLGTSTGYILQANVPLPPRSVVVIFRALRYPRVACLPEMVLRASLGPDGELALVK